MAKVDFRKRLSDKFAELILENSGLVSSNLWNSADRPFNPVSGTIFKGGNAYNLLVEQLERGSDDPRWLTMKQANSVGLQIRKGAKAAFAEFWDWSKVKPEADETGDNVDSTNEALAKKPDRFFAVLFNGSDVIGLPRYSKIQSLNSIAVAEELLEATNAKIVIREKSKFAKGTSNKFSYYSHADDQIVSIPKQDYGSESDFYVSMIHELSLWTGHHSRMKRRGPMEKRRLDSPEYVREQLVATLASHQLASMLGIEGRTTPKIDHSRQWVDILKDDKHELFRIARDADLIVNNILERAPDVKSKLNGHLIHNVLNDAFKKSVSSGVKPGLPSFIPEDKKAPDVSESGTGKNDRRWQSFEETVRSSALNFKVDPSVVNRALELIEPKFSEIFNAAEKNGYSAYDMNDMLSKNIMSEMHHAEVRQQQWNKFSALVYQNGADKYGKSQIDISMLLLENKYQALLAKGVNSGWNKEQTDEQIRTLIYGDAGRRAIDEHFVGELIRQYSESNVETDHDFCLSPLGMSDFEIPADVGYVDNELLITVTANSESLMEDAEL